MTLNLWQCDISWIDNRIERTAWNDHNLISRRRRAGQHIDPLFALLGLASKKRGKALPSLFFLQVNTTMAIFEQKPLLLPRCLHRG
jgi:hypothetical protein